MKQANVTRAMLIMCDFAEYDDIRHLIDTHSDDRLNLGMVSVFTLVNLETHSATVERLTELASDEKVWAIGETGLDYY